MEQVILLEQVVLIVWVVLAVALVIIEMLNTGILAIWFAIGAAVAAIIAGIYPGSYIAQLIAFVLVSTVLTIIGTKALKNKNLKSKNQPVYSILGKTAICTKEINNLTGTGQISINGDFWSAKTKTGEVISVDTKVKVLEIDGVKAIVEIINE